LQEALLNLIWQVREPSGGRSLLALGRHRHPLIQFMRTMSGCCAVDAPTGIAIRNFWPSALTSKFNALAG
jgi:hypothetical protein